MTSFPSSLATGLTSTSGGTASERTVPSTGSAGAFEDEGTSMVEASRLNRNPDADDASKMRSSGATTR